MFFTELTKRSKGLRFRLTCVYSFLFGIFICFFGFMISKQHMDLARQDFDAALLNFAIDLSDRISLDESGFKTPSIISESEKKKQFPFRIGQIHYTIRSIDGDILSSDQDSSDQIVVPYFKELATQADYTHRFQSFQYQKENYRAINLKISNESKMELILQVATPAGFLDDQERRLFWINLITIPLCILIASISAYIIAGNALSPIKSLISSANNIAAQNLSLRVPEAQTGDEVQELSRTLNNLLERLEKSFKAQEHFVADASHQLNTPLAIIKGELDVLESKNRTPEQVIKFHKSLREEIERLIELVKNMLLISRVESGLDSFVFRPVRLDELLMGTIARLNGKARDKKITLRFNIYDDANEESMNILAEKQLLDSLFENLLDNAIKYSPEESLVAIDIKTFPTSAEVSIKDEGPGIAENDLEQILSQRFQRGNKVGLPGTGIGLSIAYQIASHHKGQISYKRLSPKGSLFTVHFETLNS